MLARKQEKIREIEELFEALKQRLNDGVIQPQQVKPAGKKFNPVESAKTLRKLGLFGNANYAVDFEWPKKD